MTFPHSFDAADSDKLREECGVFGAIGATDASAVTALGLHALQATGAAAGANVGCRSG